MKRLLLTFIPCLASAQTVNWSRVHYTDDKSTVSSRWHNLDVAYHYAWQDLHVIRQLRKDVKPTSILDVGPGAGHWCRLWRGLYPEAHITGVDPSQQVARRMVSEGLVNEMMNLGIEHTSFSRRFEIVSAIGVLHHIMDDSTWAETVAMLCNSLTDDGVLFIGTQIPGVVDDEGYRKYRSYADWYGVFRELDVVTHIDYVTPPKGFRRHLDLITVRRGIK